MSEVFGEAELGLEEGRRIGRYLIVRDQDGAIHAVAAGGIAALRETDEGTLLMLPGARLLHVAHSMLRVLTWLDGR